MIICPDCGNQCSAQAETCPKCGHPFVIEKDTILVNPAIAAPPPLINAPRAREVVIAPIRRERSFPNWIFIPLALALVAIVFGFVYLMQDKKQESANENSNIRLREAAANSRGTTTIPTTINQPTAPETTVVVPPTGAPNNLPPSGGSSITTTTLPPATSGTTTTSTTTSTSAPAPLPTSGGLVVTAAISSRTGAKTPVRKEKFYLLKQDLDTILSKAGITPDAGDYKTTLGAAVADPNRRDVLQKCNAAITPYVVYSSLSDTNGKAAFKNVAPGTYYLYGVTKTGSTASVWSQSITINAGDNTISLIGEMPEATAPPAPSSGLSNSTGF